jgi:CheY-like chemotaxis protein
VSSVSGQGSTFSFYVKTRRVKRRPEALAERVHESGSAGPTPQRLHVLLVEDNVINQQLLSKQLKKASCHVHVANHGREALELLEKMVFDIVLMDLEMPVLNGLDAIEAIRKRETAGEGLLGQQMDIGSRGGKRLPVIAVTANVRHEQINTALEAGAVRIA